VFESKKKGTETSKKTKNLKEEVNQMKEDEEDPKTESKINHYI